MGRSWPLLGGSWALLAGPWGTKIDFPAVLVAKLEFSKNIEKPQEKQRFLRSWPPRGRSWGLLGRSWGLLARSWAVLDGQEGQKGSGPGGLCGQGQTILPPPSEIADPDPHPSRLYSTFRGQRNEENETMERRTTGKREESGPQGRGKSPLEGRGMMVQWKRGLFRTPRGPGGRRIFSS